MQFLAPWMLWGLGALAVPILIHLWQRRKVTPVPFSTLRLLKKVAAQTRRRARVEHLLLLLLRCAIFALVILAFARPVAPRSSAGFLGGGVPRLVVLALDTSASMRCRQGAETRLDAAKREAMTVIEALKPNDRVALFATDRQARPIIGEPTVNYSAVRDAIRELQPTDKHGDFGQLFLAARSLFARDTAKDREFYLFTDSQESAWRFDPVPVFDADWRKLEVQTVVVRPDDSVPANAAIQSVRLITPFVTPGETVRGTALIENLGAAALNDLLEITLGGTRVLQKPLEVAPGTSMEVPFAFQAPLLNAASVAGTASLEGDSLPVDDKFFFTIPVQQNQPVLVVQASGADTGRFSPGFYLSKALQAGGGSLVTRTDLARLEETSLDGFRAIFLLDPPRLTDLARTKLETFLQAGGSLILFPGDQTDWRAFADVSFFPATVRGVTTLPAGRIATEIKEPGNPLFANLWNPEAPFPALPQQKAADWRPRGKARALVTMAGSIPFLIVGEYERGQVVLVNGSADRSWGDLPLSPAFLPLVQQLVRTVAAGGNQQPDLRVGDPVQPGARFGQSRTLTLESPDSRTQPILDGASADAPGVYTLRDAQGGSEVFAVNVDRAESQLQPAADSIIAPSRAETLTGLESLRTWLARSRGMVPLWPACLLAALVVFAVETVLSNLLARNRAKGAAQVVPTGRLNRRRAGASLVPVEMEARS